MAAAAVEESVAPAATPRPRSPPGYPDLCGRHQLQVEIQLLGREIALLQEELQTIEGLQSVSICCKEIRKRDKTCCIWRWIRAMPCFNIMCICCSGQCSLRSKRRSCACRSSKDRCFACDHGCPCSSCCKFFSRLHCGFPSLSCSKYLCGCVCSCSKCTQPCLCSRTSCCISRCACQCP